MRRSSSVRPKIRLGQGYKYITVGSGGQYSTIEAARDALTTLVPDDNDPVLMQLIAGTFNLTDDQIIFPANSGITTQSLNPADTVINGTSGRGTGINSAALLMNNNTIFEGFTLNADATGGGAGFGSPAGTTGNMTISRVISSQQGDDTYYLFGGGNYLIDRCHASVDFDGLAAFGTETQTIEVRNTLFDTTGTPNTSQTMEFIRVDNPNATVVCTGSKFDLVTIASQAQDCTCIGSGLSGDNAVAFDLIVRGCQFNITANATHGGGEFSAIKKNTGTIDIEGSTIVMTNELAAVPGTFQDAALKFTNVSDYENGISNTTITPSSITLANSQWDVGGNTVTGFKIV